MSNHDTVVIRLTGDSGDGMQLLGDQLTISAARAGRDVHTLPDFPAEIRAPSGTVAGVSGFQLAMAEKEIFTAGESLDVLVALNPAALKHSLSYLQQGGLLIINEDSFTEKDWKKSGVSPEYLESQKDFYHLLSLPLLTQTLQSVASLELSKSQASKCKNFYVLGLVLWLFDLSTDHCDTFIQKKFSKQPEIAKANSLALMAGYNYALTLELSRKNFVLGTVKREEGAYRHITGVEAVSMAIATLSTKTKSPLLVSGYPITPASAILHACAQLSNYGVRLFQAEDEIAALCACLGAAYGGHLALSCTSGPGLDLKSEALGLAVVSELPLVLIDVQRAGASTGLPTKTGQSDLRQALYGRHGEAPLPVLAAQSPVDCFNTVIEAFDIAITYMTPVIVLLDAYLANAAEPWKVPHPDDIDTPQWSYNQKQAPYERDENLSRSWNKPGSKGYMHHLGGLEKQGNEGQVSYEADNHQKMVSLRTDKVAGVAKRYPPLKMEGSERASLLVLGWGSTYGSIRTAIEACQDQDMAVAHLHLKHLFPLPLDLPAHLRKYEKILVPELNSGHLCQLIRATYLVDAKPVTQCNGQPFRVHDLVEAIKQELMDDR